ncbi:TIGR02710 family CRISPR-associated CARF protein [Thiorhodovibrio frisius]|uniref:CRISPR-associated protein, TIGR02710 family n=1 Tax=Thiorhodovibrio frisius TaxID=631362 RepID=H8Z1Y7_9GAMM|nr:TIGR02710 family CRISPR-associated CARF protein [Thiorhodovibrio frisius]EIC21512.1 CRISPR-associated protein, TIGR02710 family [Thiorhodovibrio frisius]WPL24096.1 CRISPR-associated protein [Thiorhodovibrio frisius]
MTQTILLCTVGGSHQPILTAIRELQPVFVLFFASGRDQGTGQPGSIVTITGKGHPVEVRRAGQVVEHLPNIPTQAGLGDDQFQAVEVPTDDLDQAVSAMTAAIAEIAERFPRARLIADYTGGTKTMTAALVMAALDNDRVELQLITGNRADLIKVQDGSQAGLAVSAEEIRLRRAMRAYLNAWDRFAYGEAAEGLLRLPLPRDPGLRGDLQIARSLSQAFDAWDRFDHAEASALLEVYRPRLGSQAGAQVGPLFLALKHLCAEDDSSQKTPARLWDLWLNAKRRAAQGRYDDAVARGYRLLEWTAQWLLAGRGILTGDLKPEQIPASLAITANPDGKLQAGLRNAWELAAHHIGGEVAAFVEAERGHMLDQLTKRNYSILAHGDRPIARADWEAFSGWMEQALIPLLGTQAARAGLKKFAPQLPQAPLWT